MGEFSSKSIEVYSQQVYTSMFVGKVEERDKVESFLKQSKFKGHEVAENESVYSRSDDRDVIIARMLTTHLNFVDFYGLGSDKGHFEKFMEKVRDNTDLEPIYHRGPCVIG